MLKRKISLLLCLILLLQLFMVACSGKDVTKDAAKTTVTESKQVEEEVLFTDYTRHFDKPAIKNIASEEGFLGDLDKNYVSIRIPENTFKEAVVIELDNPAGIPNVQAEDSMAIGSPIKIDINSDTKRFDEEVIITMKLTPEEMSGLIHEEEIMIAYYNGESWDYIVPKEINMAEGYVVFGTYHFSPFWATKPTKEKRVDNFLEQKSKADWAVGSGIEGSDVVLEKMVNDMVKQKFGDVDKSLVQDVVEGIMKQDDYAKLMVSYNDYVQAGSKDQAGFEGIALDYSVLVGKHLFKVIDTVEAYSDIKGGLLQNLGGEVADKAGKIVTGVKMAEALAQGKYEDAAKHLSTEILGSFPVTKFLQTGAEVIDRQINRWKSEELEAAFKVYVNGADKGGWGYNVDPNDFEGVWTQMRGLREKIYTDAIADYAKAHNLGTDFWGKPNVGMLGQAALDKIRSKAKEQIKREFEARKNREAEIVELKKTNKALLEALEEANLLTSSRYGYDSSKMSMEQRLAELFKLRDKVVRDVEKPLAINRGGLGENVTVADMVQLIQILKSSEGGEEAYQAKLIEMGYKAPPVELSGDWSGTVTVTDVPAEGETVIICDQEVKFDWEALRGAVIVAQMSLSGVEGTYSGTVTLIPEEDDEPTVFDVRAIVGKDGNLVIASESLNGTLKYAKDGGGTLTGKLTIEVFGVQASFKKGGN